MAIKASRTDCARRSPRPRLYSAVPAFIGEAGDDDLAVALLKKARDLLDLAVLGAADGLAVEVEIDRLKLIAIDVAAEE